MSVPVDPPSAGKPPSVGVLCNPRSGRLRQRLEAVRRLGRRIAGGRYLEASASEEIEAAVRRLTGQEPAGSAVSTLCVVGGDGTVATVLTALHAWRPEGPWPRLCVAAAGMTNMTAHALGLRGAVTDALEALAAWQRGSPALRRVRHPVLVVERPGRAAVCGMFFGMGTVSDGVRFFQDRLRSLRVAGEHNSGVAIARVLLSLALGSRKSDTAGYEITSALDGGAEVRQMCLICLVTTLDRLVLGTRPYWGRGDAPLHYTLVERGAAAFWRSIPRFAVGRPGRRMTPEAGWISRDVHRVALTFDGPFVLDGELHHVRAAEGPCRITGSRPVEWLMP